MNTIEYYYSAHSAYAYIGASAFYDIAAAHDARIVHRPYDLRAAITALGGAVGNKTDAHKAYYFGREIDRWAEWRGVPILDKAPDTHAHDFTHANRMIIATLDANRTRESNDATDRLSLAILTAHWTRGVDLADQSTLIAIADEAGLDGKTLADRAETPEVSAAHDANTAAAIARPVFGSPTYIVDGDMFYGQDRLEMIDRALKRPFAQPSAP
ncbi:MAG: DsbA family protein [Pseudomonadota bacterium]